MYNPNPKLAQALAGPKAAIQPSPMAMVGQPMGKPVMAKPAVMPAVMPATSGFAATSQPMPPNVMTMTAPTGQLPPVNQGMPGPGMQAGPQQAHMPGRGPGAMAHPMNSVQRMWQKRRAYQGGQGGMGSQTPGGQGGGFQGGWA